MTWRVVIPFLLALAFGGNVASGARLLLAITAYMYVAMAAVQLGVAIWLDNPWILLMLIPAIVTTSVIIAKEERYLEEQLGTVYTRYKASVRRWL